MGQKKRVCLASIMVMEPQLLICDEPGSGLDPSHSKLIFQLLEELNQKGTTILYATHDVNQAYAWADEAVILKDGKLLCEGEVATVLSDTPWVQSAGLDLPFLVEMSRKMMPDLPVDQLPKGIYEMCKLLNYPICVE